MSVFSGALVLSKQKYIEEDLFFLSRDFVKAVLRLLLFSEFDTG